MSSYTQGSKIKLLTNKDFKAGKLVRSDLNKGLATVIIASDHCLHCVNLRPLMVKISLMSCCISSVGVIDAEKNRDLIQTLNQDLTSKGLSITGYPTLLLFKNGIYQKTFEGDRSPEKLLQFVVGR
jgi:hypothetical protein